MVEPIIAIGNLLMLPNLEEQTIKDVNQALRDMVGLYIRAKPVDGEQQGIDPFTRSQQAAVDMLGPGVYEEWMNGEVKRDG